MRYLIQVGKLSILPKSAVEFGPLPGCHCRIWIAHRAGSELNSWVERGCGTPTRFGNGVLPYWEMQTELKISFLPEDAEQQVNQVSKFTNLQSQMQQSRSVRDGNGV